MSKNVRVLDWDRHLVLRATQGDDVAFDFICDGYRPVLIKLAMRMLHNTDDAYDAVQETLVKAYRAIGDFDPERPIKPWLCRICANACVDASRQKNRGNESLDEREFMLADLSEDVEASAAGSIREGQVAAAINRLPERYRRIIMMRHFRHMEVTEIAQELGTPEGTIKSWLFRARAMLKKDLKLVMG